MAGMPLSSSVPTRWTPPGFDPSDASAPVFLVKAASVLERAHWRRDVAAQGCVYPSDADLWGAIKAMIVEFGSENAADMLEAIDLVEEAEQAQAAGDGAPATTEAVPEDGADPAESSAAPPSDAPTSNAPAVIDPEAQRLEASKALVAQLRRTLAGLPGPFAELLAARQHWMTIAPYLAAQRFCVGWEGASLPKFEARAGRVTDAALAGLPKDILNPLGWHCVVMMSLSGAARKN